MSGAATHGRIIGGLTTVPDLNAAEADYAGRLGLIVVERGTLDADLAASWGCPDSTGARYIMLQPRSGAPCMFRLVEATVPPGFRAMRSYGWSAFELTVQDVFGWPDRLAGSGFEVIGPPKALPGMPYFIPMQVLGQGQEVLYLNDVAQDMPNCDLPRAESPTDFIFIAILATPDRAASVDWYTQALRLEPGDTHVLPYTMINRAFDLPPDYLTAITVMQKGRMPVVEIDDYPAQTIQRPGSPDALPPGNALVTIAVDDLDALALDWIAPPVRHAGKLYAGRRSATVRGLAGELIELIELR